MENSKVSIQNMDLYYGDFHALKNLNLEIPANQVTAFIGPSGGFTESRTGRSWMRL